MREIDYGVFISRRKVINLQFIIISQRVNDPHAQVAGIAFLTIAAKVSEFERGDASCLQRARCPDNFVESLDAAVQVIGPVAGCKLVSDPVEGKPAARNPIRITADDRAEKPSIVEVLFRRVVGVSILIVLDSGLQPREPPPIDQTLMQFQSLLSWIRVFNGLGLHVHLAT